MDVFSFGGGIRNNTMGNNRNSSKNKYGLLILLLIIPVVYAEDIKQVALNLKSDNQTKTVENINNYIESTINYSYYQYARGTRTTWATKQGDCTDVAMLKCKMLKINNVPCKLVHGYSYINDTKTKHDYYQVTINSNVITLDERYFDKLQKVGNGIW